MMKYVLMLATLSLAVAIVGCEKAQEKPASRESPMPAAAPSSAPTKAESRHEGHDHSAESAKPGHSGEVIELGTNKIGEFTLRASRDKVELKPGGDAPIDVWIDDGVGKGVTAVRFWIGTEDAKGSIKAKADIEDGKWHTHLEIPSPMPAGSKLWVEVEESAGKKTVGSFDLKI